MTSRALALRNRAIEILRLHFRGANPTSIGRSLGITRQSTTASLCRYLQDPVLVQAARDALAYEQAQLDWIYLENSPCSECHRPSNLCQCNL